MAMCQRPRRSPLIVALLLSAVACGAEARAENWSARLVAACEKSSNLGAAMCRCVGDQAKTGLSPEGLHLLVAMLEKDESEIESARRVASLQDAAAAGTFMARAPAVCARAGIQPTPPTPEER